MSERFAFTDGVPPAQIARCLREQSDNFAIAVLGSLTPGMTTKVLAHMNEERCRRLVAEMPRVDDVPPVVLGKVAEKLQTLLAADTDRKPPQGPQPFMPREVPAGTAVNAPPPPAVDEARRAKAIQALTQARAAWQGKPASGASGDMGKAMGKAFSGAAVAAEILRNCSGEVRKRLAEDDPALYSKIRKRMYSFQDLESAPAAALGHIFTETEAKTAALALRFASPGMQSRVLAAVSPRRSELLHSEIDASAAGRTSVGQIEEAQETVIKTALALQQAGKLLIDPDDPDLL